MIRTITTDDQNSLRELFSSLNLFSIDEVESMDELVNNFLGGSLGEGHFWVVNDDSGVKGAAYYAPETFAEGVYNMYFIGVLPQMQGKGFGTDLLAHVESHLREIGVRMLLIETSGLPNFEKTWDFYLKNRYEKEAVIREYYKAGEDKIVFRKKLN